MLGFALLGLRQGLDVVGIARKDVSAVSPFIHGLVVQVDVRLREEGDETVLDVQLHRRRPGIFAASGTPEVEASALIAELPDTPHDRGHGDPLCPDRTDEGVVNINEMTCCFMACLEMRGANSMRGQRRTYARAVLLSNGRSTRLSFT